MSALITVEKHKKNKNTSKLIDRITECETSGQFKLDISHLSLSELPYAEISVVSKINIFLAYGNEFYNLPPLLYFRNLTILDISRNKLVNLEEMKLSILHHLIQLDISRNKLIELPLDLCKLPVLEKLIFHRNLITDFPSDISHIKSLILIDGSYNHIQYIGTKLESLPRLEYLNLDNNTPLNNDISNNMNLLRLPGTTTTKNELLNPLLFEIGAKTRRLLERHEMLMSKNERRSLIQRALGVRKNVLKREEQAIVAEQLQLFSDKDNTLINEYP